MSAAAGTSSPTHRHADRRAALRARMSAAELDAMLVTDLINIRYLTGFTGSNATLLVTAGGDEKSLWCTDFRYIEQGRDEVQGLPMLIDRDSAAALLRVAANGRVGFESHVLTVARHTQLTELAPPGTDLIPHAGLAESLRAVKDPDEVESLRAACAIADRALAELLEAGAIRAGRTERDVALDLDETMRRLGSDDVAFPTILAAGENSAIPHHRPTGRPLATGDLVKIDFGAVVDGYHSDMTRCFVLGPPADWQVDLHALVAEAQRVGREAIRPGVSTAEVDSAAREVIEAAGFGEQFGHGLGHGVGLEVHEAPWFGASSDSPAGIIAADMTVTVEPGVYLPGRGGVRIEDSGVVGPDGYRPLTLSPRDLVVL